LSVRQTYSSAEKAKAAVRNQLLGKPGVTGVGIADRGGGDYVVVVFIQPGCTAEVPSQLDGVTVDRQIVAPPVAG
jgi:hypothetical protein